ncbi:sugar transferase [Aeromicrobium sp. NPDC092404]|uniref:sugar transferase n=1 Tax=Aeromicrobium sp. NPDC092404 TaxID=3154976 RepID=UPI00341EFFC8
MSLGVDPVAEQALGATGAEVESSGDRGRADWERQYGRILVVSDLVFLTWTFITAHVVWAENLQQPDIDPYTWFPITFSILMLVLWYVVLTVAGTRDLRVYGAGPEEYKRVFNSTLVVFAIIAFIGYILRFQIPGTYVVVLLPFGLLLLSLSRWSWRQWLLVRRQHGHMTHDAIVVGSIDAVAHLAVVINRSAAFGYRLSGACITSADPPAHVAGVPVLGGVDDLTTKVINAGTNAVIITSSDAMHPEMVRRLGWDLEGYDIEIIVAPSLANIAGPRVHIRPVAGLPLLHVEQPSYRGAQRWAKDLLDRVGGLTLLLLFSPILVALAIAIKLTSSGRVFFVQERVGRDGKTFGMIKFRSMVEGADTMLADLQPDTSNVVMFKMRNDPRVTKVGRFLRRYSLDELPQLLNVVKGDMSLVGPRPPLVSEVSGYAAEARRRLLVRPGMTGPWQISGRSDLDWEETMRLDLYYVENWSLVGDMLILWKTFRAVVSSAGAY